MLQGKIYEMDVLMNLLKRPSDNSFDLSVLKPIDTKDITKPEPFDSDAKKFLALFAGIKDLLTNRNQGWTLILDHIEAMKSTKCHDPETQLFQSIGGEVAVQGEAYKAQLATYIRSYTKGDLDERVVKSQPDEVVDIVRELIYKYKHHRSFKILDLKSAITALPRASTPQDVEKILSDWKHQIHTVQLHDKNFQVPDASPDHAEVFPRNNAGTPGENGRRGSSIQPRLPQVRTGPLRRHGNPKNGRRKLPYQRCTWVGVSRKNM